MINDIMNFISGILSPLKYVAFLVSFILFWFIVYYIARLNLIGAKVESFFDIIGKEELSRRRAVKAWKQIQKRLKIGGEAQLKMAIIEADKILDEILKKSGYQGENMSDRLKQITPAQISNIEEIWQAHKIRNRIVHEPDFSILSNEAENIIEIYEKTFKESGLIDDSA